MSANAYEILALAVRYVFAFLMLLIVLRAWRITSVDSRRARKLRRLSPQTGIIGEMLVMDGGERAKPGMRYPVTLVTWAVMVLKRLLPGRVMDKILQG